MLGFPDTDPTFYFFTKTDTFTYFLKKVIKVIFLKKCFISLVKENTTIVLSKYIRKQNNG